MCFCLFGYSVFDCSANDQTVPPDLRGSYLAFTLQVFLLPSFPKCHATISGQILGSGKKSRIYKA